jgi:uncharacterized Zn ribbon protein
LELKAGTITLRSTESWLSRHRNTHYRTSGQPASEVSFQVGDAVAASLQDGDTLTVFRGGATELALTVVRQGTLQAAIGAVSHKPLDPDTRIEEDPRAAEEWLYGRAQQLERPDTQLVWLDSSDPDYESQLRKIDEAPGPRLVIAIAGASPEARRLLNNRIASEQRGSRHSSCYYETIDARFARPQEWLAYLRGLPTSRPRDLWIRITTGRDVTVLREEEYACVPPWHLFVLKVYRVGVPGEPSQLAIVRDGPSLSRQAVIDSTELIARGGIAIKRSAWR